MNGNSTLFYINTITTEDIQKLQKIGITHIKDIANKDYNTLRAITNDLNFLEGRIEFEYWIEQAKDSLELIN